MGQTASKKDHEDPKDAIIEQTRRRAIAKKLIAAFTKWIYGRSIRATSCSHDAQYILITTTSICKPEFYLFAFDGDATYDLILWFQHSARTDITQALIIGLGNYIEIDANLPTIQINAGTKSKLMACGFTVSDCLEMSFDMNHMSVVTDAPPGGATVEAPQVEGAPSGTVAE